VALVQLRRASTRATRILLVASALAMLTMSVVQLNATRERGSFEVEIASIGRELDRIGQEIRGGRQFSARELQERQEQLQKLRTRLEALKR
jgi:hypothetical protein